MENTSTINATPQRPEGNRFVNAAVMIADINASIDILKRESTWAESDRNAITVFKSSQLANTVVGLKEGARLEKQSVDGLVSIHMLEGDISLSTAEKTLYAKTNDMLWIEADTGFQIEATRESFFLLTITYQ
ncbi:MAG: hypothetical protein QM687_10335 [Ferruginibacter sp.]